MKDILPAVLLIALPFIGIWVGARLARTNQQINRIIADHDHDLAVDDEADMSETSDDWRLPHRRFL